MNESAATSSVNISIEILVAPFAILPSNITVTVSATSDDFSLSKMSWGFVLALTMALSRLLLVLLMMVWWKGQRPLLFLAV